MYCANCGTPVPYGINVCQNCGSVMPKENYENAPGFGFGANNSNPINAGNAVQSMPAQNNIPYAAPVQNNMPYQQTGAPAQNYAPYTQNMQSNANVQVPNAYQNYYNVPPQNAVQNVYVPQQPAAPKKKSSVGSTIGNIIWFIFGGFESAILLWLIGGLYCLTIIGIPLGVQICKFGTLSLAPFKKEIEYTSSTGKIIINIIWLLFGGLEAALYFVILGILFCITIIGIPFGKQYFKFAKLMLMPFGAKLVDKQ